MQVKLKGRIVIVTGPDSSGKDCIVEKIAECNPSSSGIIISYDGDKEKKHLNKRPKFGNKEPTRLTSQLKNDVPLLLNCNNIKVCDIESMIMQIRLSGYTGVINLVKINLDIARHTKYCVNNKRKSVSIKRMVKSREDYQPVLNKKFEDFNLEEIIIGNPRRTIFSFE